MRDFLVGLGLVFAIEGLIVAGFPGFVKARIREMLEAPDGRLRTMGIISAVFGIAVVFAAKRAIGW
jgi:hypothetical protein